MYKIKFDKRAIRSTKIFSQKDLEKIDKAILRLSENPFPKGKNPKRLKGIEAFRYRVGNYRIIYTIEADEILISAITHRKDAYKEV